MFLNHNLATTSSLQTLLTTLSARRIRGSRLQHHAVPAVLAVTAVVLLAGCGSGGGGGDIKAYREEAQPALYRLADAVREGNRVVVEFEAGSVTLGEIQDRASAVGDEVKKARERLVTAVPRKEDSAVHGELLDASRQLADGYADFGAYISGYVGCRAAMKTANGLIDEEGELDTNFGDEIKASQRDAQSAAESANESHLRFASAVTAFKDAAGRYSDALESEFTVPRDDLQSVEAVSGGAVGLDFESADCKEGKASADAARSEREEEAVLESATKLFWNGNSSEVCRLLSQRFIKHFFSYGLDECMNAYDDRPEVLVYVESVTIDGFLATTRGYFIENDERQEFTLSFRRRNGWEVTVGD